MKCMKNACAGANLLQPQKICFAEAGKEIQGHTQNGLILGRPIRMNNLENMYFYLQADPHIITLTRM